MRLWEHTNWFINFYCSWFIVRLWINENGSGCCRTEWNRLEVSYKSWRKSEYREFFLFIYSWYIVLFSYYIVHTFLLDVINKKVVLGTMCFEYFQFISQLFVITLFEEKCLLILLSIGRYWEIIRKQGSMRFLTFNLVWDTVAFWIEWQNSYFLEYLLQFLFKNSEKIWRIVIFFICV